MNQSLENVLLWKYTENNGWAFTAMGQIDNCKLHEQRTDVWHVLFGGDEGIRVHLEKCLKLVDALWTEEERQLCITKKVDDPKKFFLDMAERCKFDAWLIKYVHGHAEYLKKQAAGKKQKEWVWLQTENQLLPAKHKYREWATWSVHSS
jgi:hypothetical protein